MMGMNELSLFSGAGGGLLATKHIWRTVGYVEINQYCQNVIAQRIRDGWLDEAPIFGDINTFISEGYAASYTGLADVVTGGFPCQDISCAGGGAGIFGEKSRLWFKMAEVIRIVRPRYVVIENSPTLLVRGFEHVLGALHEMGYDARWGVLSAAKVGALHLRNRLWIVAHANSMREPQPEGRVHEIGGRAGDGREASSTVPDTHNKRRLSIWSEPEARRSR